MYSGGGKEKTTQTLPIVTASFAANLGGNKDSRSPEMVNFYTFLLLIELWLCAHICADLAKVKETATFD